MKDRITLTLLFIISALVCFATEPPASLKYLDGYFSNNPDASVTVVMGKTLKSYDLDEYRGLTLVHSPESAILLETAVKKDAAGAIDKELAYRQGNLYYAFLTLPTVEDGKYRYIFFLNQTLAKGNKLILIYMKGKASADKIKKMIKK